MMFWFWFALVFAIMLAFAFAAFWILMWWSARQILKAATLKLAEYGTRGLISRYRHVAKCRCGKRKGSIIRMDPDCVALTTKFHEALTKARTRLARRKEELAKKIEPGIQPGSKFVN